MMDYEECNFCKGKNCWKYFENKCLDTGCQYTAKEYYTWLKENNFKILKTDNQMNYKRAVDTANYKRAIEKLIEAWEKELEQVNRLCISYGEYEAGLYNMLKNKIKELKEIK